MKTAQSNQPRRFKQQGFTLIELLIVVAIIGVLAAVGVPQYGNYLDRSSLSACQGELSSFRSAVLAESTLTGSTTVTVGDGQDVEFNFQACNIPATGANSASNIATAFIGSNDLSGIQSNRGAGSIDISGGNIVRNDP